MKINTNSIDTTNNININLEDDNNEIPRIYSDSFTSYQPIILDKMDIFWKELIIVYGLDMEIFIQIILKGFGHKLKD